MTNEDHLNEIILNLEEAEGDILDALARANKALTELKEFREKTEAPE
jgi:hypothetical protein